MPVRGFDQPVMLDWVAITLQLSDPVRQMLLAHLNPTCCGRVIEPAQGVLPQSQAVHLLADVGCFGGENQYLSLIHI